MQYNCYNVVSVWGAAPPRPPASESPSSSAPLPSKTSYATVYTAISKGVGKFYIWAFISCDRIRIHLLTYIAIHLLAN